MRNALIRNLLQLAGKDRRIWLVVGDVGYSVVEPFRERFPDRFVNTGVAEQNMMGVAAGLALSGNIVYTYTFANFTILRCLEQIRNDVCFHNANVKILGMGGGLTYGAAGMTHHGTEDLGAVGSLPKIAVIAPADPVEAEEAVKASAAWDGPCYIQMRKAGEKEIHRKPLKFAIGKALPLRRGGDVTIFSIGWITHNVLEAAERLGKDGFDVGVVSTPTLKPFDERCLLSCAKKTSAIVTVEENSSMCLAGQAARTLATSLRERIPLLTLGLPGEYSKTVGSQEYLLKKAGLSAEGIHKSVKSFLKDCL